MSFLAPMALAFAAAIPVVILFYLLKRKRVVRLVPSTLLWQRFLAESQASAPFQRLRHNWLLLLQILLLVLAVLALARPFLSAQSAGGRLLVVILDASASMRATDDAPSRFERARKEALQLVEGLQDGDRMVVLLAGAQTEVRQSPTGEKGALRRALNDCAPTDAPTHLLPALKMADSLIRDQRDAEIHLFSDGAVGEMPELENRALPVSYHRVGRSANNLGIVVLDVRANPDDATQRAVYTGIANFSTNELPAELELRLDGRLVEARALTVPPGETSGEVFMASQASDGVFTVNLKAADDLAADNTASIVSLLPRPVRVLLVTRGNRFLERALSAVPQVHLATAPDMTDDGAGYDFVVLDDVAPSVWPAGNVLAIHVANTNWFEGWDRVETPAVVDWRAAHPLLRHAGFDNVLIAESLRVRTPDWATPLVDASQTPLLLAGESGRQRIVWVGFDVLQSTWPLRVSFPIFVANAVDWLNPSAARATQQAVRTGEPLRLPVPEPVSAEVVLPDGTVRLLAADASARDIVFGDTQLQGIYRIRAGTNESVFCVNLLDAGESDIRPRDELIFGKYAQAAAAPVQRVNREVWRWLALAALAVLLFEWWFYHRRTA